MVNPEMSSTVTHKSPSEKNCRQLQN